MELVLIKLPTDSTYREGRFQIVEGWVGPLDPISAENARAIIGGEIHRLGPARQVLQRLGVIDIKTREEAHALTQEVGKIYRKIATYSGVKKEEVADSFVVQKPKTGPSGKDKRLAYLRESGGEEAQELLDQGVSPDDIVVVTIAGHKRAYQLPAGFNFPNKSSMISQMKDAGFDYKKALQGSKSIHAYRRAFFLFEKDLPLP